MADVALSHLNAAGEAHMVDVSAKAVTQRTAIASGLITMAPGTLDLVRDAGAKKGDVLATARIAGIMAAKRTSDLIPLCHPLALSKVTLDLEPQDDPAGIIVTATVRVSGPTGVEMEALTAVSVAALTIYDMLKAADKAMTIGAIHLVEKTGGKSGPYRATDQASVASVRSAPAMRPAAQAPPHHAARDAQPDDDSPPWDP